MMAAFHHRRAIAAGLPAAYTLPAPLQPQDAALTVNIADLAAADVVTVVLRANKPANAEQLYMLFGIRDTTSSTLSYTDLAYAGRAFSTPAGLSMNSYGPGFTGSTNLAIIDGGGTHTITAELSNREQGQYFKLYVDGQLQPLGSFDGQLNRPFGAELVVGDTSGYRWPGTIFSFRLYPRLLADAEREQAEATA